MPKKPRENTMHALLYDMNEGDVREVPLAEVNNARASASMYGAIYGRRYSTHMNRDKRVVEITRRS